MVEGEEAHRRLVHMLEASDRIAGYVARGRAAFDGDPAVRDAILYQVVVLGEASKAAVSADAALANDLPQVRWSPMARMRDRVVHRYWATDADVVWDTATIDVPKLRVAVADTLSRLTPPPPPAPPPRPT